MLNKQQQGFTLVELLLIMVIVAVFLSVTTLYIERKNEALRIDKTALQMQFILNSALAFYVNNGRWPDTTGAIVEISSSNQGELQPNYLPNTAMGTQYTGGNFSTTHQSSVFENNPPNTFIVFFGNMGSHEKLEGAARIIAGKLPNGHFENATGRVYAYIYPPGLDPANATNLNFAGLYHHGVCVPVPACPTDSRGVAMTAQVFVMPVSVSGVNDQGTSDAYPLSSFTAYATGTSPTLNSDPPLCTGQSTPVACSGGNENNQYWRVCMQVVSERGDVNNTRSDSWGQYVTLGAFTRCSVPTEPTGSDFNIFGD